MSFTPQAKPLLGKLAEVFPGKVIKEMSYQELRTVMASAPDTWRTEAVAAASLGVTLEELLGLPGRYTGAVGKLVKEVMDMHGLIDEEDLPKQIEGLEVQPPKH